MITLKTPLCVTYSLLDTLKRFNIYKLYETGYIENLLCNSNFIVLQSTQDEKFCFIAEWYDPHAALIRKYQLSFYTKDNTVSMVRHSAKLKSSLLYLYIQLEN